MIAELTFPVRYAETDAMGIVHHSNYIVWFEAGRVEYMRQAGLDYAEVERRGHFFAVAEVHARYVAPARFGERVTVRTRLLEALSRMVRFDYEIVAADGGRLLVEGSTKHICIDRAGCVTRIPREILAVLVSAAAR